jgi:uncharacterized protein YkwD
MYRVALPAGLSMLLCACSLGISQPLSFGFGSGSGSTAPQTTSLKSSGGTGLGSEAPRTASPRATGGADRLAKLDDKAPKGSFDRAPTGALADRDYSSTALNVEQARDLINAYRREKGLKPLSLNAELT